MPTPLSQVQSARDPEPDRFSLGDSIDERGTISGALELGSRNGVVRIGVPDGTSAVTEDGEPLSTMELLLVDEPPRLPEEHLLVGSASDLGPDGSTFNPALRLTLQYHDSQVPAGVAEEDLTIAYFDEDAGEWIELEGDVDTEANTVTTRVRHFTTFAILGGIKPAAFSVDGLTVSPAEATMGESVTISARVTNTGALEGSYDMTLEIHNVAEATERVVLAGGASRLVSFTVTRDVRGSYLFRIGEAAGRFDVVAPTAEGASSDVVAGGAIGISLLAGLAAAFFTVRRRRATSQQG
jgi:hypothetical protein